MHYVGNQDVQVKRHFHGLREALPTLCGVALFDRRQAPDIAPVECLIWKRREIENYLCSRATLEAYALTSASDDTPGPLFTESLAGARLEAMRQAIEEIESALAALGKGSPWSPDLKVSDEFLDPLFRAYFNKLDLPNLMNKKDYCELAEYVPDNEIDPEIRQILDRISLVAERAMPTA